jgi:hypothetical protein
MAGGATDVGPATCEGYHPADSIEVPAELHAPSVRDKRSAAGRHSAPAQRKLAKRPSARDIDAYDAHTRDKDMGQTPFHQRDCPNSGHVGLMAA